MKIFEPKNVSIGKDVKKIDDYKNFIIKYFKNKESFDLTIDFYKKYNFKFIPRLIKSDLDNLMIKQEYVGNLLSLNSNLPDSWEKQINNIRKEFIKNNIYIEDLRFLPYTPLIVNNITVYKNKIYIVDLTMCIKADEKYINYKFDNLIFQINSYLFLLNYINYIFLIIPHLLLHIIILIFNW